MKQMTAKQLRNEVVNRLWSYGNLPKNIQTFIGDEVAFMMEIIKTKTNEALTLTSVVGQSEQLCDHPKSERSYIGQNMLRCNKCGKEFS